MDDYQSAKPVKKDAWCPGQNNSVVVDTNIIRILYHHLVGLTGIRCRETGPGLHKDFVPRFYIPNVQKNRMTVQEDNKTGPNTYSSSAAWARRNEALTCATRFCLYK